MARNKIKLSQIVNDYLLQRDDLDFDSTMSKVKVNFLAKRSLRELQKTVGGTLKSVRIPIVNNIYAELPNDYFTMSKIGVLDASTNQVKVLGRNDDLNISGDYILDANGNKLVDSDGIEILSETPNTANQQNNASGCLFYNYWINEAVGLANLYGVPAGNNRYGYYRVNETDNRIELSQINNSADGYIILEYVSDATMQTDPLVDQRLEEAIKAGVFHYSVLRKSNVPANIKMLARKDYNNQKRIARKQLKSFKLYEAVQAGRTGNKQSPKF
jgi:hypothetical protein